MKREFTETIRKALEAVSYVDENDNERFRSAVQDLGNSYSQECKFFQRNASDRFLEICRSTISCESEQLEARIKQAAHYLENEYWIDETLANEFSEIVVLAFVTYKKGTIEIDEEYSSQQNDSDSQNPLLSVSEGEVAEESIEASMEIDEEYSSQQNDSDSQNPLLSVSEGEVIEESIEASMRSEAEEHEKNIVIKHHTYQKRACVSEDKNVFEDISENNQNPKSKTKGIIGLLLFIVVILIWIGSCVASNSGYDTETSNANGDMNASSYDDAETSNSNGDLYASSYDVYLEEVGDSESIEVDASVDNYDWYWAFDYDDSIISVEWEDVEDEDNFNIVIKRVGEGETDLEIYAADNDTDQEIDSINPAYVTVY